jgi:DNA (cytosine-5)-methyltransferase 1
MSASAAEAPEYSTSLLAEDRFEFAYEQLDGMLRRSIKTSQGVFGSLRRLDAEAGGDDGAWWLDFLRGGAERSEQQRGSLGVIDLFCGSGGLSLGASSAARALGFGLEHDFAADLDPQALGSYVVNHRPTIARNESVAKLVTYRLDTSTGRARYAHAPSVLDEELAGMTGRLDLLLAGPPCQGHSTFNNKTRFNDPRNMLYLTVPALAVALDIPAVVIENVPGVTASKEGVVRTTSELLQSSGYELTSLVLRGDQLGWPQTRKRFFLVATKGWKPVPLSEVVASLAQEARPVSWALEDILESSEKSIMTESPSVTADNRRRIDYLHDHGVYDLPNSERPDCHRGGTTYTAVYGRMHWDRPAQTITTGFMTAGRGRYVHPIERRTILAREAARLQGFPDDYRFETASGPLGRSAIAKAIGDAVPSILGFAATLSALGNRPS